MHDTLIQGCIGVSTVLEAASRARDVSPQISGDLLDRAREEVRAAVEEARLAVWNLRQNSFWGERLASSISDLARRIARETGIPVRFQQTGKPTPVGSEAQRGLVVSIREALHNAVRHGAPRDLSVTLAFDAGAVHVTVADDGCGFDTAVTHSLNGHYGLIGMRERMEKLGGEFRVTSAPGAGARVEFTVPSRGAGNGWTRRSATG